MRYKLLKNWASEKHGKTLHAGVFVIVKDEALLEELVELGFIEKPKTAKPKAKKNKKSINKIKN